MLVLFACVHVRRTREYVLEYMVRDTATSYDEYNIYVFDFTLCCEAVGATVHIYVRNYASG